MDAAEPIADALPVADADEPKKFWLIRWLTSPHLRWLLLAVLYIVLTQNPQTGLGVDLCNMHRFTGAPCPGCGMTRSGANMVRGDFGLAFRFHPFGYIFIPVLFALAGLSLLPLATRQAIAARLSRRERLLRVLYLATIWGFLVFGLVRFVLVLAKVIQFPFGGMPPAPPDEGSRWPF